MRMVIGFDSKVSNANTRIVESFIIVFNDFMRHTHTHTHTLREKELMTCEKSAFPQVERELASSIESHCCCYCYCCCCQLSVSKLPSYQFCLWHASAQCQLHVSLCFGWNWNSTPSCALWRAPLLITCSFFILIQSKCSLNAHCSTYPNTKLTDRQTVRPLQVQTAIEAGLMGILYN